MLNFYPPLLFTRVKVVRFAADFRSCRVRVGRSLLTRNLNGTTFGGAIFNAFDPIYPILYWQVFARRGTALQVWLKAAEIDYWKAAASALRVDFALTDADVLRAEEALDQDGRTVTSHEAVAVDAAGDVCARARMHVYMRHLREGQREVSGF